MKITETNEALICFSEKSDGDFSLYNFDTDKIISLWNSLSIVKERRLPLPVYLNQVHKDRIIVSEEHNDFLCENGDAIITKTPMHTIGVFSADCLPLLIAGKNCAAAVHAGWRGSKLNIAGKTVKKLVSEYGASVKDLRVFVGPCINECCLEMGNEVFEEFLAADRLYARFFIKKENKWHLNLRKLNRYQLCEAGVIDSSILDLDYCTYCEEDNFYSFRRQKKRNGSMFSFIVLKNC